MPEVKVIEEPMLKIVNIIRESGFVPSDIIGSGDNPSINECAIMTTIYPAIGDMSRLFGKKQEHGLVVAELWLDNQLRGARKNERWVIEVFGRNYLTKMRELAEKIIAKFSINIEVVLLEESPRQQWIASEHDW